MPHYLYVGSDNVILLESLKDPITNTYINSGTITFTMEDEDGNELEIPGVTWPASMTYITGSDGQWYGEIPASWPLQEGKQYKVAVTIVSEGRTAYRKIPCLAKVGTSFE